MSFFDKLKNGANSALTGMGNGLSRFRNSDLLPAIASSLGLMVAADGKIETSEIDGVMDFCANDPLLQAWALDVRTKAFEDALESAGKGPIRQAGLLGKIAKLKGKAEAETLVQLVLAVANADGDFAKEEIVMFKRICNAAGLNSANYGVA